MNRGMKEHVLRAAACLVTSGVLAAAGSMVVFAAGSSLVGVETLTVNTPQETVEEAEETTRRATQESASEEAAVEEQVEETEEEVSMVGTIAVAYTDGADCFNIRSSADSESDVVGYLYDSNFAEIIGEEGDWYLVQSGNCVGYVAKYLMTTGEEAQEAISEVATPVAQVNASALMVRSSASEEGEVLDMLQEDQIVYLEEDLGDWALVSDGTTTGYVSAEYVSYAAYLPQAETHEEAEVRIAQEEAEYAAWVAQQEAEYEAWLAEQEQLYLEQLAIEQAEWEAQNQAWIEYLQSQGAYADEAQATADAAYEEVYYAQDAYEQASQELNEAYYSGDEEVIAAAEENVQQAAEYVQTVYEVAETAQAEADAADAAVYEAAESAGIDTTAVIDDTAGTTSEQRQAIVDYALQFVGNPYVYGGTSLTNGTDCSGFTQSVLAEFGISVDRTAGQQAQGGTSVDLDNLQPGDLLFYNGDGDYGIGHVSMYIGDGQVVHASSSTTGIIVSDVNYRTASSASNYID